MPTFVEFVFPFKGPFGREMVAQYKDLALSITQEPGFLWKIWIESQENQQSGGLYLFEDQATAKAYLEMHKARLSKFGVTDVETRILDVNETMSALTRGPLAPSAT